MRRFLGQLRAAARLAAVAAPAPLAAYAVLTLAAGLAPVAAAALLRALLDTLPGDSRLLVLALAGVGVAAGTLPALRAFLRDRLLRAVAVHTMDRLYRAIGAFTGIGRLENPAFRDQLRLAQQAGRAGPGQVVDDTLGGVEAAVTLAGFLGLLVALNPWLALIVLTAAGPALLAQLRLNRIRAAMLWGISHHARREAHYGDLLTSLAAAKELRLLGLGGLFRARMLRELSSANAAQAKQDARELRAHGALAVLAALISGAALLWAVSAAVQGELSIGDVSVLVAAVASVQLTAQALVARLGSAHEAMLLFQHYRDLAAAEPDLAEPARPRPVGPLRAGIELCDVWFRYGPDKPWVLRGVTLHIPHGRALALVGLNGAGKSTLIKLLCRFYDPTLGSIRWDGQDLRDLQIDQLRERIGAVFQDFMQYELSAAENVGLGDVDRLDDRSRITGAAERAGVHDVLAALPNGYDTLLTNAYYDEADRANPDTGILLSGGQWQRVALARAFLRDRRDLMILDEPTAGLDAQAEHDLHERLRRHRAGRTSVLISHRLGAVRDADLIVVLDGGKVGERGTHAELMALGGGYAKLFRLQSRGYRAAEVAVP